MTLPTDRAAREAYILEAVRSGRAVIDWVPLTIASQGRTLRLYVMGDALKVDGVRVPTTPKLQQAVADVLGVLPLTSKIADEIHRQAGIVARAQPSGGWSGSPYLGQVTYSTAQAVEHSERVDRAIGRSAPGVLVSTVGKDWILHPKAVPPVAANYGWHDRGAPYLSQGGLKLWQQVGTRHNTDHGDYSQIMRFARRDATLDGVLVDLGDVYRSPTAAYLVSYDGPLPRLSLTGSGAAIPAPGRPSTSTPPAPVPSPQPRPSAPPAPSPGPAPAVPRPTPEPPLSVGGGVSTVGAFSIAGIFSALVLWWRRKR